MDDSVLKHQALGLWLKGQKHHLRGDLERAIELYTKSLGLYPTAEAYTFRGWAYSFQGRVGEAIDTLQRFGISQLPVSQEPEGDALEGIVGSVSEQGLLDRAYRNPEIVGRTVGEVMDRPLPTVAIEASLDDAFALLAGGSSAVLAVRAGRPAGVITRLDLLEYLAHRSG